MKTYRITITLKDGSNGLFYGVYSDGFAAVIATMDNFPTAQRISARRLA